MTEEVKTRCEYCQDDFDGYVTPIEKNGHALIHRGMNGWKIDLRAKGWHGEAHIKFCPMCGRKLDNCADEKINVSNDSVKVVRCNDCRFWDKEAFPYSICGLTETHAAYDCYCSWAETKEE